MKRSLRNAYVRTFITLVISIRWLTYLRSLFCRCEGHSDRLIEASSNVVAIVADSFLTRDDPEDGRARTSLRQLLSASVDEVDHAERCLREVGFPEPCTTLALLCNSSIDVQNTWREIAGALNTTLSTLSVRLTEVASALHRDNELADAYLALQEYLSENSESPDRAEKFIAQVKSEISARMKEGNIA